MDYSMKPLMPVRYYRNTILLKKDDVFDFLMEIAYARRTNQFFDYNHYQHEQRSWPTVYDSPKNAERIKKTY